MKKIYFGTNKQVQPNDFYDFVEKIKYKRVRITWYDITASDETWMHEDNITKTKLSVCVDEGYLYKKTRKTFGLFQVIL